MTLDTFTKDVPPELLRVLNDAEHAELEATIHPNRFTILARFLAGASTATVTTTITGIANWTNFSVITPNRKFWGVAYDDMLQVFEDAELKEEEA